LRIAGSDREPRSNETFADFCNRSDSGNFGMRA
jgi:hypothetical protein